MMINKIFSNVNRNKAGVLSFYYLIMQEDVVKEHKKGRCWNKKGKVFYL